VARTRRGYVRGYAENRLIGGSALCVHLILVSAARNRVEQDAQGEAEVTVDEPGEDYPWVGTTDERFTLALVLDVTEVLHRHGYSAPTGAVLVELTAGLYRALHDVGTFRSPPWF
jgi:hypothetical protein